MKRNKNLVNEQPDYEVTLSNYEKEASKYRLMTAKFKLKKMPRKELRFSCRLQKR
jgi:hypothetical protein